MIIKILLADYFNPILSLQVSILNLLLRAGCKPDQDCVRLAQLRWPQVPMFADPIIITIIIIPSLSSSSLSYSLPSSNNDIIINRYRSFFSRSVRPLPLFWFSPGPCHLMILVIILLDHMVTLIINDFVDKTLKVTFEQEGRLERIEKEVRGEKHCSVAQRVGQRATRNPSQLSQILNVHHPLMSWT